MKRLACALLTGVLAASTAALPLQAADMEKGITVNCNDGDPGTLDPFAPKSSARSVCLMQMYDKLCEYDAEGNLVGVLAKSWTQSGREIEMELYEGITDTAGNLFTANDAVYSIQKAAEGGNTCALVFENMEVIDDGYGTFPSDRNSFQQAVQLSGIRPSCTASRKPSGTLGQ